MHDIADWLRSHNLERYIETFAENDVDVEVLPSLTDADLKELGVTLGHRRKMQKLVAEHAQADVATAPSVRTDTPRQFGAAEHRQLAVLFCDLADSTGLSTRLDVETYRDVLLDYQRVCTAAIEAYGGYVARIFGDGLLIYFGYPQAHEDDSDRAARSALAILEAMSQLPAPANEERLQVRIGIATGAVVVGDIVGEGASQESAVLGETPNLAARMQALAKPGCAAIDDATRRLIGDGFSVTDLGAQSVKGISTPVQAWQLLAAVEGASRFERTRGRLMSELVGRDEELALLQERWRLACEGEGQVVVIGGEAGLGKSSVMSAFRARLPLGSYAPLSYQCSVFHVSTALHPIAVQLRHAAGIRGAESAVDAKRKLRQVLSGSNELIEHALPLLGEIIGLGKDESATANGAQRKEQTLTALIGQLSALQAEHPLLIVFEDVHWIDPTTSDLVDMAVRWAASHRALLLVSHRPEYQSPWTGEAHVTTLSLRKLTRAASSRLVDGIADQQLPEQLAATIVDKADGIPLFVEELTKAVLEASTLRTLGGDNAFTGQLDAMDIPATLQASLTARLDALGGAKETAQLGAVIGRVFGHGVLAACSTKNGDALTQDLERLEAAGLVSARGTGIDRGYIFKHALIQDSAYDSMLSARRRELHGRVATCLETNPQPSADIQPELIAHHLSRAGDWERAIAFWRSAARRAVSQSAMHEAYAQISQAIDGLAKLSVTPERQQLLLDLLIEKVTPTISVKSHSSQALEDLYLQARPLCERLGTTEKIFPLLYARWSYGFTSGQVVQALEWAQEFATLASRHESAYLRVVGDRLLGTTLAWKGETHSGLRHLVNADNACTDAISGEVGFRFGQDAKAAIRAYLAFGHCAAGDFGAGLACAREAVDRAAGLHHALTIAYTNQHVGILMAAFDHTPGITRCIDETRDALAHDRMAVFEAAETALVGIKRCLDGDITSPPGVFQRALRDSADVGFNLWHIIWVAYLARCHLATGALSEAEDAIEQGQMMVKRDVGKWYEAELLRIRAHVIAAKGANREVVAGAFMQALKAAEAQPNRVFELRIAADLVEHADAGPARAKARERLQSVLEHTTPPGEHIEVYERARTLATTQL